MSETLSSQSNNAVSNPTKETILSQQIISKQSVAQQPEKQIASMVNSQATLSNIPSWSVSSTVTDAVNVLNSSLTNTSAIPVDWTLSIWWWMPSEWQKSNSSSASNSVWMPAVELAIKDLATDIANNPKIPWVWAVTEETKKQLWTVTEKVIVTETVKVEVDLSKLNFKWTRFEQQEKKIKENSQNIFNDENWVSLMKLIQEVKRNPTPDEDAIIKWFFKDQKWLFDEEKLLEAQNSLDWSKESKNIEKVLKIAQEIKNENPDVLDSKVLKVVKTEKTISRYDPELAMRRLAQLNPNKMAIDSLLWNKSQWFQKKIVDFFRWLSLDKILETYKNWLASWNMSKVFESEANEIIKSSVVKQMMEFRWKNEWQNIDFNDPRFEAIWKLIVAQKKVIAQIYFKQSMFFISNFIEDTQKWKDYFEGLRDTKETERVSDLIWNKDFNHYSILLNEELTWRRKILTNLQKKQIFASDIWLAMLSLKVYDTQNATSLLSPWVKVWEWLYEKRLEYKKWEYWKLSEWLFLWWERYELQWITNVSDVVIYGNEVVIYGEMFWKKTAININKERFIDWMQNLALNWNTNLESSDWKIKFWVKKIIA